MFGPQIPMYQHPPGQQAEYAPDGTPITPPRDRTTEVLHYLYCLSVGVCVLRSAVVLSVAALQHFGDDIFECGC